MPSPTTMQSPLEQRERRYTLPSLLDVAEAREPENAANGSSSGEPDAGSADKGTAHTIEQQASPRTPLTPPTPPQADDRSFLERLRAGARRVRDRGRKASETFKEKISKTTIPHH